MMVQCYFADEMEIRIAEYGGQQNKQALPSCHLALPIRKKPNRPQCVRVLVREIYVKSCGREKGLVFAKITLCHFSCWDMSPIQLRNNGPEHAFILEYDLLHEDRIVPATRPFRHVFRRKVDLADDFT